MFCGRSDCYRINTDDGSTIPLSKNLKVRYSVDRIRKGKKGGLDVLYDRLSNRWYAHIPIELQEEDEESQNNEMYHTTKKKKKYGSIDLGICNIVTFYSEEEHPIIYSGRAVLSDWRYHTKEIASLQSQLPKNRYTPTRIGNAFRTRQRRFKHAINSMLRDLFERIKNVGITDIIVGDLTGIRDNKDYGSKTNQKLHNFWSHAKTIKRIKELEEEYQIQITEVSERERNTSKTCSACVRQTTTQW